MSTTPTPLPPSPDPTNTEGEESSIFDLIDIAKSYLRDLLLFSWLIAGLSIAGGYYFYSRKSDSPTTYTATLTFMLSEDKGFQQGMLGSLFGMTMSNIDAGGNLNLAKLDELIFTRSILQKVLFTKIALSAEEGKERRDDYLINHYIDFFGMRSQWKGTDMENFSFKHDSVPAFTRSESSLMLTIYGRLTGMHLAKTTSPGGIMSLNFSSTSETFSFEFVNTMFRVFDEYYTEKTTEKQKILVKAARERVEQLRGKMEQAENAYINYLNQNGAAARGQNHVLIQQQYLARELQVEMEAYFASVRAREAAEAALAQQVPLIQIVDAPVYPLPVNRVNASFYFLIGAVGGGVAGLVLVVGRRVAVDYYRKEREKYLRRKVKSEK